MIKVKEILKINKTYINNSINADIPPTFNAEVYLIIDYEKKSYSIQPSENQQKFRFTDSNNTALWNAVISAMKDANKIGKQLLEENKKYYNLNINNK